jgi:oligopeptide transport system substrate-binding protein
LPPGLVPFFAEDRGKDLAFNLASAGRPAANPESSSETFSGTEFSFANVGPNPTRAEFIQGQWLGNLGIDIKLNPLDPPAFGKAFVTGDFDLAFVGFGEDYHHPENWLLLWTSDGGLNTGGYSNPEFDSTVEAALAETDPDEAVALWQRADEILMDEDVAMCPLMNSENAWLVKAYVRDFIMTGADGHPGDYFYWKTAILAH